MHSYSRTGFLVMSVIAAVFVAAIQGIPTPTKPAAKATVYVFWSTDCPVAMRYLPRFKSLLEKYRGDDRIQFELLFPNSNETKAGIARYIREQGLKIQGSQDINASLARTFTVRTVPYFVVCDASSKVIFTGPLDDNQDPSLVKRTFVAAAVEDLCSGKPRTFSFFPALGCEIARDSKIEQTPSISYLPEVRQIINRNCVRCHLYSRGAPFSLINYAQVYHWRTMIGRVVEAGTMPPFSAYTDSNNLVEKYALSDSDREKLIRWVREGAVLDTADAYSALDNDVTPTSSRVSTEGSVEAKLASQESAHQYYYATWNLSQGETVWLNRIRFGPTAIDNIRDISVYRIPKSTTQLVESDPSSVSEAEWIGTCSMGAMTVDFPAGIGKRMEPGDRLAFKVHRFSTQIRPSLPMYFSIFFEPDVKGEVESLNLVPKAFAIDPEGSHEIEEKHQLPNVVRWLSWRATTRLLGGTAWVSVDQHLMGAWGIQAQFWQPEYHPLQTIEGNSITFRAVISNWGMAQIQPFSPPHKIESGTGPEQESVVFQATYARPISTPMEP